MINLYSLIFYEFFINTDKRSEHKKQLLFKVTNKIMLIMFIEILI